ncbi:hypothetical protein BKI52_18130 [marine bacterium AO1-C]|nr:hypothetical protein BKI52_18130 [marine bacterium AO1-C]
MSYQEFKPSPLLSQYIDSYWISSQGKSSRVLPDGFIDIIFNFGKATPTLPAWGAGVAGMMTRFRDVSVNQSSEFIGIRFRSMYFHQWCAIPLHELKNLTISTNEIMNSWESHVVDQIYEEKNIQNKLALIEQKLYTSISESVYTKKHSLILSACNAIKSSFTSLSLDKVAQDHNISLRQLERLFRAQVGVTMKEYQAIIRFKHTLQNLADHPNQSLLHLAYDMGYFDHAHLTREINKMAGQPPSQLK